MALVEGKEGSVVLTKVMGGRLTRSLEKRDSEEVEFASTRLIYTIHNQPNSIIHLLTDQDINNMIDVHQR